MSDEDFPELRHRSPGAACAASITANTMAMAFEVLGDLKPMAQNPSRAQDPSKARSHEAGRLVVDVLKRARARRHHRRPRRRSRTPPESRARVARPTAAPARVAREIGVQLDYRRLRPHRQRTPLLCDLARRKYVAVDLSRRAASRSCSSARRRPACSRGHDHRHRQTIMSQPRRPTRPEGQRRARPDEPLKAYRRAGHPARQPRARGCVVKLAGHEKLHHEGSARVDGEEAAPARSRWRGAGDVVVIRNEGPAGGPGMREMLAVTGAINGAAWGGRCAAHRRASPAPHGFMIGHVAEAARGPIAAP